MINSYNDYLNVKKYVNNSCTPRYTDLKNSFSFRTRSLSQIKKENKLIRQNNIRYIDNMYRAGKFFKYDLSPPHYGTYRSQLQYLENKARNMIPELDFEKNNLNIFHNQCINLRQDLKNDYNLLNNELKDEVGKLEDKLTLNLSIQKDENLKYAKQLKEINTDLVGIKNTIEELKNRVDSLKLRIDGTKLYNSDGIPVLDTKIE